MTAKAHRGTDAKVNACMYAMFNYAGLCNPEIVVMESVPQAFKLGRYEMLKLRAILEERTGRRYELYHVMQNALELGGAAFRPRYFLVCSAVPFGVEYPLVRQPVLNDVIGDLDGLGQSWLPQPYRRPATWWSESKRSSTGYVDGHRSADNLGIRRALELHDADPLGWPQGAHLAQVAQRVYELNGELPSLWNGQAEKIIAKTRRLREAGKAKDDRWQMGFTTMTRWYEDQPGRVITGAALGAVMHPTERRTITHREAARIMGFPDDWVIMPSRNRSGLTQWWGKGITVECGRWIGGWARAALDGEPGSMTGELIGEREHVIKAHTPVRILGRIRSNRTQTSNGHARPAKGADLERHGYGGDPIGTRASAR